MKVDSLRYSQEIATDPIVQYRDRENFNVERVVTWWAVGHCGDVRSFLSAGSAFHYEFPLSTILATGFDFERALSVRNAGDYIARKMGS